MLEWEDSRQPSPSWKHLRDVGATVPVLCRSVGWLIVDNKRTKVLAPNMGDIEGGDSMQVSGTLTIPSRAVRRIVKLKDPW